MPKSPSSRRAACPKQARAARPRRTLRSPPESRSRRSVERDRKAQGGAQGVRRRFTQDAARSESKLALRARVSALQAQANEQSATIQRLRADVVSANEKLARQADHFMEEMRRLGAGTRRFRRPPLRRSETPCGRHLPKSPPSLRASRSSSASNAPRPQRAEAPANANGAPAPDEARASNFLRALTGADESEAREAQSTGTDGAAHPPSRATPQQSRTRVP